MATKYESIFSNLKQMKNTTGDNKWSLMRGVMDFGNLAQWDMYETGYAFLKIVKTPRFLEMLAEKNTEEYKPLLDTYKKILEFEFRQINGLPNIDTEEISITNGISQIDLIGKTTYASNITFSMPYFERSGAPLTKLTELYLRGIKDPKTTYKHYNGLIADGSLEAGLENETWSFLVGFTDNTGLKLERAFLLLGVQPVSAPLGELYEYTKGTVENKELSLEFRGYAITGKDVNARAVKVLDYLNDDSTPEFIHKDESTFEYSHMNVIDESIGG